MIELSVIRDLVAIFGVIAGFSYYVLMVRNQNKTRQAQFYNSMARDYAEYNGWFRNRDLLYMEWEDYDDFEEKYGSNTNPVAYAQRLTSWSWMNNLGIMVKDGLVDENMVYDSLGSSIILMWEKWEPIFAEQRVRYMGENWMEYFEYLANKMRSIQNKRNISWKPSKTYIKYVPDQ